MEAALLGAGSITALSVSGLMLTNVLRDRGVDASTCRRLAAILGGVAYLAAVLFLEAWTAVAVAMTMAVLVLALRLGFRDQLRGLSRGESGHRWSEVAYPMAGAASLAIGWGMLGDRWLAFVPIAFMAWGDNAAGFVRDRLPEGQESSVWPSAAMLVLCLATAAIFHPYWIGAVGALAATATERFRPTTHPLWDDNWVIVVASLSAMGHLSSINS